MPTSQHTTASTLFQCFSHATKSSILKARVYPPTMELLRSQHWRAPRPSLRGLGTAAAAVLVPFALLFGGPSSDAAAAAQPTAPAANTPATAGIALPNGYKGWPTFSDSGCRVWIGDIHDTAVGNGDKDVWTYLVVRCVAGRKFQFKSQIWEADPGFDDFVYTLNGGSPWIDPPDKKPQTYRLPSQSKNVRLKKSFDHPDLRGEYFQKVWLRVWVDGRPFPEPWTKYHNGKTRSIRVK